MSVARKTWLFSLLIILLAVILWLVVSFYQVKNTPLLRQDQQPLTLQLPPGKGTYYLMHLLREQHLLRHPYLSKLLLLLRTSTNHLKAGEYEIEKGMTFGQLLDRIIAGRVLLRQFTLVEGRTYHELLQALQSNPHLKHLTLRLNESQILAILGAKRRNAEGLFYPDTYFYTWGESDLTILRQAFTKMKHVLREAWYQRARNFPYPNVYNALIIASLIEKETALDEEKPLVAAVILNRLRKKMPLQIDATVLYGLHKISCQKVLLQDLRKKTPYNTYRHFGLPPTPIALPGKTSIEAALHPAPVTYLFYVATGNGGHTFSENYEEHLQAVKAYRHKEAESEAHSTFLLKQ